MNQNNSRNSTNGRKLRSSLRCKEGENHNLPTSPVFRRSTRLSNRFENDEKDKLSNKRLLSPTSDNDEISIKRLMSVNEISSDGYRDEDEIYQLGSKGEGYSSEETIENKEPKKDIEKKNNDNKNDNKKSESIIKFNLEDEDEGNEEDTLGQEYYLPLNAAEIIESRPDIKIPSKISLPTSIFTTSLSKVGGLDPHIYKIKESIVLPILYPEFCKQYNIISSRGILFHGPPGTGKTFLAKSLVHECSKEKVPIAYFHVNNADILSKWVGESEIRLKKIFETAKLWAPSIIFFDEIDGLAPIRDENDRPSASLVSSLLAYMDGFKDLGKVLVIGSTNRIEAIDPALRRPGRFDEELYFALPNLEARKSIINAITNSWPIPLDKQVIDKIINLTKGYSGADLKSLCDKAVVAAFIRRNPDTFDKEIGASNIDCSTMKIEECDFMIALKKVTSVSQNLIGMKCQSIVPPYDKLLNPMVEDVLEAINKDLEQNSIIMNENLVPKVVIINGNSGVVQNLILSSTLNNLEDYRIVMIDLTQLCIPDDVTGCKELSLILNGSQFYSTKTLFVIKEVKILHVYCPQLITILRNFMLSPCKKGSVTFLITCDKLKDMSFYFKDVIGKVIQTNDIYLGVKAPFVESLLKEYFDPRIINDNNNNNNDNNLYKGNSFESIQEEKKETSYNQCSLRNLCLSNIMYAMEGLEVQDIIKFSICLKLELIEPCYTALRKQIEQVASEFKKSKKSGIQYIPL